MRQGCRLAAIPYKKGRKLKADFTKLDRAFNPQCVVVVGDKRESDFSWLRAQSTFKGKLYSVQINPKTIKHIEALGVKNYTSLLDIPDPVDLVIVSVPRAVSSKILEDCIQKGVAAAHFFTAGFAETDTEEGRKLERLLIERAKEANFHLIGPNCMGIFNPKVGIRQQEEQYTGFTGPVGFISQSGTHAGRFSHAAHLQGVDINKSVSFGNGVVLDSADFLEYFGNDTDIKAIGMYLEGVRDGRKFLTVLREVAARKPVVIWKGGRTEAGGRVIASHTGSLAVPRAIWDAAMRQFGVIKVVSLEELVDTLKALLYLSPVHGNRVGITGGSGGQSVAITDVFVEAGLEVPLLTQKSYDELATFFTLVGGSYRNPVDTGNPNRRFMERIMEILERDANIDNLVLLLGTERGGSRPEQLDVGSLILELRERTSKPVMVVLLAPPTPKGVKQAGEIAQKLQDGGVPAFVSLERGARALKNALNYYNFKGSISSQP